MENGKLIALFEHFSHGDGFYIVAPYRGTRLGEVKLEE